MYKIEYANKTVINSLKNLRSFERRRILDSIDSQLRNEPGVRTKHRKPVIDLIPPWEYGGLVWELSIGEYRVFYDLDAAAKIVHIRAIRHKPPHKTTEEIL